jgi:two-component sensor histidine kinase
MTPVQFRNIHSGKYELLLTGISLTVLVPFFLIGIFPALFYYKINTAQYLIFHNITEIFSIIVSMSIFGLGWFTFKESKDTHALFLSTAFFAIGLLDFYHTLSYAGMPDFFTPNSVNKASQLWIAARIFTAAAFLISAFIYREKSYRMMNRLALLLITQIPALIVSLLIIFFPDLVPETFIPGKGLTLFKIYSEYLIILLMILSSIVYFRRFKKTGNQVFFTYITAFILCIVCELSFTLYKSAFDSYNMLGHIYKIIAFIVIYITMFTTSITIPYKSIQVINDELKEEISERVKAETQLKVMLSHKEMLIQELYHRTRNSMQVILGMLIHQSKKYTENKDIQDLVGNTEEKIRAILLTHQMLYKNQNLSKIPVSDLIIQLIRQISKNFPETKERIKIDCQVEEINILLDTAIPFGLVLNELISNSYQHGFPDGKEGIIAVKLQVKIGGQISLIYSDTGIGFPADFNVMSELHSGFNLMMNIIRMQMQGSIHITGDNGFRCEIEFPDNLYQERV